MSDDALAFDLVQDLANLLRATSRDDSKMK